MPDRVRVLSLGAGVQSSALLLKCDRGEVEPVEFAVFADTQAEPREVTAWLQKLRSAVKTPIVVVTAGDIAADHVAHFRGDRKRVAQAPLYATDRDGKAGMIRRHCTQDYKIRVVDRAIRTRLGYLPKQQMKHQVELLIGISSDEQTRMRIAQERWKTFVYPLVDLNMNRAACIRYVEATGLGTPPRSACYFCPYKSDAEWRHLRDEMPDEWAKAVEFDRQIRRSVTPGLTSEFFVHRQRVPLDQADISKDDRQLTFLDECEGMCGN